MLSAWLFNLLPVRLKNLINASRWNPLHLSSLSSWLLRSCLPQQLWTLMCIPLAVWDCWKLSWILCLLASTFGPNLSLSFHMKNCQISWMWHKAYWTHPNERLSFLALDPSSPRHFGCSLISYKNVSSVFYMDFQGVFHRRLGLWDTAS